MNIWVGWRWPLVGDENSCFNPRFQFPDVGWNLELLWKFPTLHMLLPPAVELPPNLTVPVINSVTWTKLTSHPYSITWLERDLPQFESNHLTNKFLSGRRNFRQACLIPDISKFRHCVFLPLGRCVVLRRNIWLCLFLSWWSNLTYMTCGIHFKGWWNHWQQSKYKMYVVLHI